MKEPLNGAGQYADGVILGGDYADAIDPKDRRFEWASVDRELATPDEQYGWVGDLLDPIADKILCVVEGNHDFKIKMQGNHDYVKDLAKLLNVPPEATGYSVFTRLNFRRGTGKNGQHRSRFDIWAHHGSTNAQTRGGKVNKLLSMDRRFEADVYLMSHVHDIEPSRRVTLTVDENLNIKEHRTYYALTGGFLKGYERGVSNYVERGLFEPTTLGGIALTLHCEKNLNDNISIHDIPLQEASP